MICYSMLSIENGVCTIYNYFTGIRKACVDLCPMDDNYFVTLEHYGKVL